MYEDLKRYTRWVGGWVLVVYFLVSCSRNLLQREIAAMYGVSRTLINDINVGRKWKSLSEI